MKVHLSSQQLHFRLQRMLDKQAQDTHDDALLKASLVVAFVHHEPDLTLLLDGRGEQVRVHWDSLDPAPDLLFELTTAEAAHRFWAGELNVMSALKSGEMRMRGNLLKALALLPSAGRSQAAYRQVLAEEAGEGE